MQALNLKGKFENHSKLTNVVSFNCVESEIAKPILKFWLASK